MCERMRYELVSRLKEGVCSGVFTPNFFLFEFIELYRVIDILKCEKTIKMLIIL
jgi:hypothetical protein